MTWNIRRFPGKRNQLTSHKCGDGFDFDRVGSQLWPRRKPQLFCLHCANHVTFIKRLKNLWSSNLRSCSNQMYTRATVLRKRDQSTDICEYAPIANVLYTVGCERHLQQWIDVWSNLKYVRAIFWVLVTSPHFMHWNAGAHSVCDNYCLVTYVLVKKRVLWWQLKIRETTYFPWTKGTNMPKLPL